MSAQEATTTLQPKSDSAEIGPCKYKLKIEVAVDKIRERIDSKYKDLSDKVALPGFRKGKAPRSLLERKFGKDILDEVKSQLLYDSFEEVREQRKLEPLGEPELDLEKIVLKENEPFAYEVVIEVRPTFDLPEYKGLSVEKPLSEVTPKELEQALENLRQLKAEFVPAEDGVTQEGDHLVSDFELFCEGKSLQKVENRTLTLNSQIVLFGVSSPEFYKALLKKQVNTSCEVLITLPKDFKDTDLVGKSALLKVSLKGIKRKKLPDITDEWAKSLDFNSAADLREEMRKRVLADKEQTSEAQMAEQLVHQLVEKTNFPLPEGLIQKGVAESLQQRRLDLALKGLDEKAIEQEVEKHKGESRDLMVKSLKVQFILDQIAQKERVFVTEDELEARITAMASQMGKWPHEVKQYLTTHGLFSSLRRQMREEKVKATLLKYAAIQEKGKKQAS